MVKFLSAIVAVLVVLALTSILFVLPVYWLWNWLMPTLFGLPTITVWQAVGLLWLSELLFRSHGAMEGKGR